MKTIFLQHKHPELPPTPLPLWLPELNRQAIVLCSEDAAEAYTSFGEVNGFRDYDHNACVERRALEMSRREPVRAVVAISEWDMVRAGMLRDRLGLPGQSGESAGAFRDKVLMKEHVQRAGIPVPEFRRIRTSMFTVQRSIGRCAHERRVDRYALRVAPNGPW
jgi:biotin carboxylase